jgi:Ca2+-binding RTX toxin-like protein
MPARNGRRRRLRLVSAAALLTVALPVTGALAEAPGLPRPFTATRIDSPEPRGGGSFGWGIASADLNRDGKLDLLVAQSQDAASSQVFIFDGATGQHIDTIKPPELNPGGADPVLAFVYVETMPDIGSCASGQTGAGHICSDAVVGDPDGVPEILVGARGKRVNVDSPATDAVASDPPLGRGYIIDGATRAVLKRIDMPLADRQQENAYKAISGFGPHFARVMSSAQAMAPCAGSVAENNNAGIGPCPPTPLASRIGDLNGDGVADIVITARNFLESPAQAATGSQCRASAATTCTSGKAWAYSGKIAGTDPRAIEDTALYAIQNPLAQTGGQEFGGNMYRVGDVNTDVSKTDCNAVPVTGPDTCAPEFVIPARNLSYPFAAPTQEFTGVGAAFLVDGAAGASPRILPTPGGSAITSPEPQKLSQFSGSFNGGRPVGDLGASTAPDILLPAALQNAKSTDDGKIWAFNAVGGGGGATGSWQFASMTDPEPYAGSNFGGAFTGVGNIADGPANPANELLVGGFHFDPFTETNNNAVADVNFVNIQTERNLMTIPNPDGARGDGFGVGLIPMGDLNGDGFLDFAVSAYLADLFRTDEQGGLVGGAGRAWILKSDNSPPPPPPSGPAAVATGPAAPAPAPAAAATTAAPPLQAGACTNRSVGTDAADTLKGTLAGDEIFSFGGGDTVMGYQGEDCVDAGSGNDTVRGGDSRDKLLGRGGADVIYGDDGRDDLFGGNGNDRLYGGFGRDMLAGGEGNDLLVGGADADRLYGEGGKDRIIGGDGRNHIDGGAGNDSIDSRNGETDRVICGTGRDKVTADRADRLNGCERVSYKKAAKK